MAASFAFLRDVKPFKTSWKVQVRVLHTWKTYTTKFGETFYMVLFDTQKEFINRFENKIKTGEWRTLENFSLSIASGQFKPTNHRYKMSFMTQTVVTRMESLSHDPFLSITQFDSISSGNMNPNFIVDIVGQVVNVEEMETIDVNNSPTKKEGFELRDDNDSRIACTIWGSFAEKVFLACEQDDLDMVIYVRSVSNAFNTSLVEINPDFVQIVEFKNKLPNDGLALVMLENRPRRDNELALGGDFHQQFPTKTITLSEKSTLCLRMKVICTVYAIDSDWSWYYISCKKCNKKVVKVNSLTNGGPSSTMRPQFWCDGCHSLAPNVQAMFKLHVYAMDSTDEMKLMLFDSMATEIVGCSANSLIEGDFGQTYQFLVSVEHENLWNDLDIYKVVRVLSSHNNEDEQNDDDSHGGDIPPDNSTGDQVSLLLTSSQDCSTTTTPSSKRSTDDSASPLAQSSTNKKLCLDKIDVVNIKQEKLTKA
ncbi:hypothetical protein CARUB_v10028635mg [Capsella rubella]|uniref:DUF223 domain-containing protein n=1 Tax=Capsella rubella TaxID=81985 RepID=R0GVN5_9BRAS|nr:hypothetical protein CARUB_v10028635mg [Capsella rubella]